jgi:2-polyprenyl-3-methyl-5-hydroxy-6-metoxy-1,4-benzoquinol methylase
MHKVEPDKAEILRRTRKLFYAERRVWAWRYMARPHICPFEKLLSHVPEGAHLLDIGCGGGLFLGLLAMEDPTLHGIGVDTSPVAIERATRMANRLDSEVIRFSCVRDTGDWPAELYDVVSMIDVLHHVPSDARRDFFLKAAQHVDQNGLLLCKEMRTKPKWKAAANILQDLVMARQWVHHTPRKAIENWALEARLRLVGYEEWDRLWSAHSFWVFQRD